MQEIIKLIIVDDDPDFIYLIQKTLKKYQQIQIIGCCTEKREAVSMALAQKPDLVLMDLDLGESAFDGIWASREIRIQTAAKILVLTASDTQETILKASREAFISGYIFKSQFSLLPESILALARGHTAQEYLIAASTLSCLSEAETAVFYNLIGKGVKLNSSAKTIANQTTQILKKLGLDSKKDLVHLFRFLAEN